MPTTFQFEDCGFTPDCIWPYTNHEIGKCIVIDNGSHSCRAGWASDCKPKLNFRNLIAKLRKKGNNCNTYFGNDITDLEDRKWNIRTQFENDVVTHFETQEFAFDYLFEHLGIDTSGCVKHPVCITESLCIPNTLRNGMSEVLFECYRVPNVIYGVDSLFSFNRNLPNAQHGLIIGCGYQTTHVIPIVNGSFVTKSSRRMNVGGLNMMLYLNQLMHLKFPQSSSSFNLSRAQELLKKHLYFAEDYFKELEKCSQKPHSGYSALNIQVPVVNVFTEKDLEMRKLQARRLKDINQKKREEKLKLAKIDLQKFTSIAGLRQENLGQFKTRMLQEGLKEESHLNDVIEELQKRIAVCEEKSVQYFQELNEPNIITDNMDQVTLHEIEEKINELENLKMQIVDKRQLVASRKQALNKRKSYASKERMRILSQLAKSARGDHDVGNEDTFGMKDEDWDIYKYVNKYGDESDDEQTQEKLNEIEHRLSQYNLLLNRRMIEKGENFKYLPLATELFQVPEIFFQPSLIGFNQCGLIETISYVLNDFDLPVQAKLVDNVFVTGGLSNVHGLKERLLVELRAVLPFQTTFNVHMAQDPLLDSWCGARDFVQATQDLESISITLQDYEEHGIGYLKEHRFSNEFVRLSE